MGRDATKAAGNPWYQARKKAAEYDDRLCSRESAAEQLGMSVSSLADAELGNTKFMPVDKAVLMADRYNAPWLLNHYCLNECPIGCRHSLSDEVVGIDRVTVKLLKSLKTEQLREVKDTLLDIAADGKITEDEKPALQEVLTYLDDLAKTVSELKTIGEMALNEDGDAHGSKYTREHENDFSFWYPKIKDCGIQTPLTFYTKLPSAEEEPEYAKRLYEAFYMEHPKEDEEVVKAYLEERVIPKLKEMGLTGHVFVKNGRFSNKFNANGTCNLYGLHELYRAIILINYEAICCGAEGADEIVVRKFIESSAGMTPCIYNGLPLRPEFRVFYDFDARKPIFTANYWDYDYVYPHLYHATDKIIFEHERERLEGVYAHFKDAVQDKVADAMQNVQGLTGQWSVDVLMDEREKFWLIDMAIAQRSAYWEMRPEGYAE